MTKLLFPPIKPAKFPNRVIYGNGTKFKMAETQTGQYLGKMKVTPMVMRNNAFYKNKEPIRALCINDLQIQPFARRKNAGSDFVKFAKYLSREKNCGGRVYTVAYNPEIPPHKFWRKMGFATTSQDENKTLDFIIEYNLPVPPDMSQGSVMFLEK